MSSVTVLFGEKVALAQESVEQITPAHHRAESGVTYKLDGAGGPTFIWNIDNLQRTLSRMEVFDGILSEVHDHNLVIVGTCVDLTRNLIEYAKDAKKGGAKAVWLVSNCAHLTQDDRAACREALLAHVIESIETPEGSITIN